VTFTLTTSFPNHNHSPNFTLHNFNSLEAPSNKEENMMYRNLFGHERRTKKRMEVHVDRYKEEIVYKTFTHICREMISCTQTLN
jgi:hypothetical protein